MAPRRVFVWLPVLALCLGLGWLGCDAGVSDVKDLPDVSALVTRDVAVKLTDKGHFALADVPAPGESEITKAQALELALFWARGVVHLSKSFDEEAHGGPIDYEKLRLCGRVYFARSVLQDPGSLLPPPIRRIVGPWWVTTLCNPSGKPQILAGVSALNGHLLPILRGLPPTQEMGSEFDVWPIPRGRLEELLLSPEEAVRRVAGITGELISREPELVALHGTWWLAWRVEILRPARVRAKRSGAELESRVFLVGRFYDRLTGELLSSTPAVAVPAAEQVPGLYVHYADVWNRSSGARPRRSLFVPLRPGAAVRVILVDEGVPPL
ncbi:MAG: hypothetical protein KatS3mg081_1404 [Gemmatimonadales bacterium]|nr:MAG: hypothetical protein KatS3mg081_1404 [Gemmatimonadales bacterium]